MILGVLAIGLSGCAGTIATRINQKSFAGAYPYSSMKNDWELATIGFTDKIQKSTNAYMPPPAAITVCTILGVLSVPLDLALDTVFLPVDLVCWPLGFSKNN